MSFETCEWFNKEKVKLSSKIPYFNVIKEKAITRMNNNISRISIYYYLDNLFEILLKVYFWSKLSVSRQ